MNVISVNDLNVESRNDTKKFIAHGEKIYSDRIEKAVDILYNSYGDCPVLLISGPSGSGKTTTAKRISERLGEKGISSHAISLDSFYLPKTAKNIPIGEDGKPDLESPYRLDLELIQETLKNILNCQETPIPKFNFADQMRIKGYNYKRQENEICVIEGTHALNPLVSGDLTEHCIKMYISVRTRLKLSDKHLIHPSLIRLLRRISRDVLYRGKDIKSVFDMFKSVSYGEKKYITPFKKDADIETDTFILYEALVYESLLKEKMKELRDIMYSDEKYRDIFRLFDETCQIDDTSSIPGKSIIREFIGGSDYEY